MFPSAILITCLSFTFVSAVSPPTLHRPLKSQLVPSNHAVSSVYFIDPTSAWFMTASRSSTGVRVPPLWSFSIGLQRDTFLPAQNDFSPLKYTSTLNNGSPLPKWLNFHADTLTFGGHTPAKPEVLHVVVTASSSANITISDSFTLIVSSHDLTISGPLLPRNVTTREPFSLLLDDFHGIKVDGLVVTPPADSSKHRSFEISLTLDTHSLPWLTYDTKTRVLKGTPPSSNPTHEYKFPVKVLVTFPDESLNVSTTLPFVIVSSLFTQPAFPTLSFHQGDNITYSLAPFIKASPSWDLSASVEPKNTTWLHFDPHTMLLDGTIPSNAVMEVMLRFVGRDKGHSLATNAHMRLKIIPRDNFAGVKRSRSARSGKTAGVVFGVIFAIVLFVSILMYAYHTRNRRPSRKGFGPGDPVEYIAPLDRSPLRRAFMALSPRRAFPSLSHRRPFPTLPPRRTSPEPLLGRILPKLGPFKSIFHQKKKTPPRPWLRKSRIGRPIAILQGSTGLLASFVRPRTAADSPALPTTTSGHHIAVTAGMPKNEDTPVSDISHVASKGSLEGPTDPGIRKTMGGRMLKEGTAQDRGSDDEPLGERLRHLRQSPSPYAVRTSDNVLPPSVLGKKLPHRPGAPTPSRYRPHIGSTLQVPSASSTSKGSSLTSILRGKPNTAEGIKPVSILKSSYGNNSTNTSSFSPLPSTYSSCVSSSTRPAFPSSPDVPQNISPPPSIPLPQLPSPTKSRHTSTGKRIHFGDSSLESMTSPPDSPPQPRLMQFENGRLNSSSHIVRSPTKHSEMVSLMEYGGMTHRLADEEWKGDLYVPATALDGEDMSMRSVPSSAEYDAEPEVDRKRKTTPPLSIVKNGHNRSKSTLPPLNLYDATPASLAVPSPSPSPPLPETTKTIGPREPFNFTIQLADVRVAEHVFALDEEGQRLPNWLNFDPRSRSLWGVTPPVDDKDVLAAHVFVYRERDEVLVGICEMYVIGHY